MLFISFLLLFSIAKTQEDLAQEGIETIQEVSQEDQLKQLQEQKLKKERDTIFYTCIILARMHLGNYGDELLTIVNSQQNKEDIQGVWMKMYTTHAIECSYQFTYDESVQVLTQVRLEQFDKQRLPGIFQRIDFNQFRDGSWDRNISDLETAVWKYIEDFESALAEDSNKKKQQEYERELDQEDLDLEYLKLAAQQNQGRYKTQNDYQAKVHKTNFTDILLLVLVFTSIGIAIFWLIRKLGQSSEEQQQKKKKNKTQ